MGYSWNHEQYGQASFLDVHSTWDHLFGHLHGRLVVNVDVVTADASPSVDDLYCQVQLDNGSLADHQSAPIVVACSHLDNFDVHVLVDSLASADDLMFHVWCDSS